MSLRSSLLASSAIVVLGAFVAASAARAQTQPTAVASPAPPATASDPCGGNTRLLATLDRPTVGYSACAVPAGSLLLEEGYQNQSQGGASSSTIVTYPQGFERVGVAKNVEFDVLGPVQSVVRAGGATTSGLADLGLGFKVELPQRGRFTYAVDGLFTAATGARGIGNGGPMQTLNVDVAYALSPAVGLGTTLAGVSSAGFAADGSAARYGYFEPSVVVTAQIPNAYQFYLEFVQQSKLAPAAGGHVFTDFGVQKLVGRNVELDLEYGASFTPVGASRFRYLGAGFGLLVE